jgi:uncharacterized membrane protein
MRTHPMMKDPGPGEDPLGPGHGERAIERRRAQARRLERRATGLGWLSIGLGLAQIAAPRAMARLIGVRDDSSNRAAMLGIGVREIASGVGILTGRQPAGVWMRVVGDVMDLAVLGRSLVSYPENRNRVAAATAAVAGITVLDWVTARGLTRGASTNIEQRQLLPRSRADKPRAPRGLHIVKAVTIADHTPDEVYRAWRDIEDVPAFMRGTSGIDVQNGKSRWRAQSRNTAIEWTAELFQDREAAARTPVSSNMGSIRFVPAPGGRGTEVRVDLRFGPAVLGGAIGKLIGQAPDFQVAGALRRFKQRLELGEVVHSDASIHRGPHPACPPSDEELAKAQVQK